MICAMAEKGFTDKGIPELVGLICRSEDRRAGMMTRWSCLTLSVYVATLASILCFFL